MSKNTKNKIALYAGSFDPFTVGHKDIVDRALTFFDNIVILVAISSNKNPLLSLEERKIALKKYFKNNAKVSIDSCQGLIVDYAKKNDIRHQVRGLRPTGDFDNEFPMATMNKELFANFETIFLPAKKDLCFVSSSLIRDIFLRGGDISNYVPKEFVQALEKKHK